MHVMGDDWSNPVSASRATLRDGGPADIRPPFLDFGQHAIAL
jgi:hypothetical protein